MSHNLMIGHRIQAAVHPGKMRWWRCYNNNCLHNQDCKIQFSNKILILLKLYYPKTANIRDKRVQNFIRKGIEEAWRIEAKKTLPERLYQLAKQFNFNYNGVSIKNSTSRWGSCSGKNNINLSLHLMRLPDQLIDYVILHELTHTVHKNHGTRFWNLLQKVCPETIVFEKEMKNYRTLIYWVRLSKKLIYSLYFLEISCRFV